MNANLPLYQRRFENAPDPEETSASAEYQNCLAYIDSIHEENDGSAYPDSDPRDNFGRHVTQLHDNRLLFEVPHSDVPNFTLRWPDADATFIDVRKPLPDDYFDTHDDPNLNHYTSFVLDFAPYDEITAEADTDDSEYDWVYYRVSDCEVPVYTGTRYFIGA